MNVGDPIRARGGRKAIFLLLSFLALLLGASTEALAINCVADAGGTVDGFVNYPVPPAQINIDGNCRIQNYPASNPMTSNFSFDGTLRGCWSFSTASCSRATCRATPVTRTSSGSSTARPARSI